MSHCYHSSHASSSHPCLQTLSTSPTNFKRIFYFVFPPQASKRGGSPLTSNHAGKSVDRLKHVTLIAPNGNIEGGDKAEGGPKRSSFKISLKKAFSRKKGPVAAVHDPAPASPTKPLK